MAKVLEYYRLNFGHQLVVYRRSQDKNTAKEILGSLANLGTRKNYDLPDNSLQWIFPFSGHSQTARIVEQQIQASNLCISPSEWSVAQCQDVAEFAAWFRRHSVDLQDTHLPARRDVCSMDFLGTLVPVTYSVLEKKFLSINVRELQERDILAWRNAHMSDYLASFDVLLVQGIPQKKIADGVAELLSKSFKGHAAGNLHIFWKADSVDVKTCLVDEYDSTPIMGCLFVIDKEALIVVNLEDNSDEYLLSNPSKDLPLQSVGIMKRIYVRLCQTRLADCSEYPLPAIYSGTWNHRQEKKASFTEQQRYLETIERQILRKNRVADGSFLKTNRSLNVWVPSETDVLQIPDDLLYTPDAKQHHLFDWLSETEKLVRKRWPFSSQLSEPGIGNWVATLSGITTPLSVEAMSFDTAMRSPNCLYGKVGRCSFTDPPCSGFQAVNGIQLKPFTI